jgi:hypothetical protein
VLRSRREGEPQGLIRLPRTPVDYLAGPDYLLPEPPDYTAGKAVRDFLAERAWV